LTAVEHLFETNAMLDVAVTRLDGQTVVDLGRRAAPPLPVLPALSDVLPDGLRRGSVVSVSGSISLLLALIGAASASGAWCALIGLPRVSAEAAAEYGIDLSRLAVIPGASAAGAAAWTTTVGALLDAVDVVVARPPARVVPGDARRLAARARAKESTFIPYYPSTSDVGWPNCDARISVRDVRWLGAEDGSGRLTRRRMTIEVGGRGKAARGRSSVLWLPTAGGGAASVEPEARPLRLAAG